MKRGGISWLAAVIAALVGVYAYARLAATPIAPELRWLLGQRGRALLELDETELILRAGPAQRGAVEAWLAHAGLDGAVASAADDRMVVVIADEGHALASNPHALRGDPLRFHIVLDGARWTAALARRASDDGPAVGLRVEPDSWTNEELDREHRDYYLVGPSREALEAYLAKVGDLGEPRPDGSVILYERVRDGAWRTYLANGRVELGAADVASADVYWDPTTRRPEVLVVFTADGAQRFGELTAHNVGRKMAIVVDDTVTSAPVIRSAIRGGKSNITMGENDPRAAQRAAEALVASLRTPSLPPGVELIDKRALPGGGAGPWRIIVAAACGLLALALAFVGARLLPIAVAPRPLPPRTGGGFPWGRLAVTLIAGAAVAFAPPIYLRGVDASLLELVASSGSSTDSVTIFTLGLTPFITAFVLVELVALAVPRWRPLRLGGAAERARLDTAAIALGLGIAMIQGYFISVWLRRIGDMPEAFDRLQFLVDVCSIAAGSALLLVVAGLVNRFGAGNGYLVVFFASSHPWAASLAGGQRALFAATAALVIATTGWILHRAAAGRRLPTSGVVPLAYGTVGWLVVGAITKLSPRSPSWIDVLSPDVWPRFAQLSAIAGVGALCAVAFSRRGPGLTVAATVSTVFVVLLAALQIVFSDPSYVGALMLATVTAGAVDFVADLRAEARARDLVEIRPLHRIDDAADVAAALAEAGIPCHLRNLAVRTLYHFFAPMIPVGVLVPRGRAAEAAAVVERTLAPR